MRSMTELQILTNLLSETASRIAETDKEQSNNDAGAGFIEGKLSAYREMAKSLAVMINKAA